MGKNGPKYSASKRPNDIVKPTPAPNAYRPMTQSVQNRSAQYSLGTQKRTMLKELNNNPGPGAHDSKSQLKGSKFGFGTSTRAMLKKDTTPGPGSYEY